MERQLRNLQSQLHQQQQQQFIKPSSTTPTHAAAPMLQPTTPPVQQTPQQINRPTTPASSQDAPDLHPEMDVAQSDDDDDKTPAAPKKRARKSTKVSCDVQIERLEERLTAKIDNLAGTIHTLTTTTEQRFARLEEMMAALAVSQHRLSERVDLLEQTLKPIICSPVFAAQFANHPYLQEQAQQPTQTPQCQNAPSLQ